MKKLIVLLFVCLATIGSAFANWKPVDANDANVAYIDLSTVRKSGQFREAWVMYDNTSPTDFNGRRYLSSKIKQRFDCASERVATLAFVFYAGNMGTGEVIYTTSVNNVNWDHVVPGSVGETLYKAACKR